MKLSDYVVDFLVKLGIRHNFLVSGGAVIHLVDSTAKHPEMEYICAQHEQNGAAAADMYARVSGNLGLTMTTSGPGATNILTSVCNAYFDSIPMICITGQVSRPRLRKSKKLRQRGFQETDVVSIFESVTKYAKLVLNPEDIRYELEKAVYLAKEGRPGPVLLDIPDDLQRVDIDPLSLKGFFPPKKVLSSSLEEESKRLLQLIAQSSRPVLILGNGVHHARAEKEAIEFAERFHIPVVTTWGGADLLPFTHELNMGGIGVCGPRAGNFAVEHADLVITFGSRLSTMITGGKQSLFAPRAKKVMVDVDIEELKKFDSDSFELDLAIESDLLPFLKQLKEVWGSDGTDPFTSWRKLIASWAIRYPICLPDYFALKGRVSPYVFIKELSKACRENEIVISDTGANVSWTMQAFETKKGQRLYSAWNNTPMGYSVPASVGAALASNCEVVCIIGDGGLMMCLQELGTIRRHSLPVKIFLFNNKGHGIQRQTIDTWLSSKYAAIDEATGLYFPDYKKLAEAFQLPYVHIRTHSQLGKQVKDIMEFKGPIFCNVELIETQKITPMLVFGSGFHDLHPRLSGEELDRVRSEASQISREPLLV